MAEEYVPIEIVQKLSSQGKSEQEIVAQLRLQGFTPQQISSAMNQAIKQVVKGEAGSPKPLGLSPEEKFTPGPPTAGVSRPQISAGPQPVQASRRPEPVPRTMPPAPPPTIQTAQPMRGPPIGIPPEKIIVPPQAMHGQSEISVEELVEAIVNERWIKFEEKLSIFESRDVNLQQQIQEVRKHIDELRSETKKQESTLVEKLDDFGGSIEKTQARIGSIESAFKEFVPSLAESVKSLGDVVDRLKKSK